MGGRGAASPSGRYGRNNEKKYGSEYHTVWMIGNIKFIKPNGGRESTPLETMPDKVRKPNGRVYVLIDRKNRPHAIAFYDNETGMRNRTLDFSGHKHKEKNGTTYGRNHSHKGYEHLENGTSDMNAEERAYTARILQLWRQHQRELKEAKL